MNRWRTAGFLLWLLSAGAMIFLLWLALAASRLIGR